MPTVREHIITSVRSLRALPSCQHADCLQDPAGDGVPAQGRVYKACSRCQERKIKCDGALPQCSPCRRGKLDGCDVSAKVVYTQQHVQSLEKRIAWLEELVGATYEDGSLVKGLATGTRMQPKGMVTSGSEPLVEEVGLLSLRGFGSYGGSQSQSQRRPPRHKLMPSVGSMSGVTLTRLVSSAIRLYGQDLPQSIGEDPHPAAPLTHAAYPPRLLAAAYVNAYLLRVHRWYPFLDLNSLQTSLDSVYTFSTAVSDVSRLTMSMVFALGCGGHPDPFTPEDYFTSAYQFIPAALAQNTLDTVRSLLLLCLYGLRAWRRPGKYAINAWLVVGHALRISIELGLMRNKYSDASDDNEAKRKVWWSVYALERQIATGLCRVNGIRNEGEDVLM